MEHRYFRRFLDALDDLNPAQIEDAQTKIRNLRRKTEFTSEIEARTNEDHKCHFFIQTIVAKGGDARGPRSSGIGAEVARRPTLVGPGPSLTAFIGPTSSWSH